MRICHRYRDLMDTKNMDYMDINDYDLRFRVSLEKNVKKSEASNLLELSTDERFNIKIRLKQRATFTLYEDSSYKIIVDCTISKTSQNLKTVNDVNENYEIELEVIRKKDSVKYTKVKDKLIEKIDYILKNFSIKIIDIINELVTLFNRRCAVDCPDNESKFGIYIFYFKEIAKILSKDERLFFVGLLVLLIGILLNFVDLSN